MACCLQAQHTWSPLHALLQTMQDVSAEACGILAALAALPATDKRATLIQLIDRWRALKVRDFSAG
jgi:hypothetical protein